MRHFFRLKDPEKWSAIRAVRFKQDEVPGVPSMTVWRIEHEGYRGQRSTLEKYLEAIEAGVSVKDACEPAPPKLGDSFNWRRVERAAKEVGDYLFNKDFDANIVLTFSGHSWIFASIAMAESLPRDRLLAIPIFLGLTMDWKPSTPMPRLPGFTTLEGLKPNKTANRYGFVVLIPGKFPRADHAGKRRVAVIDDSITSGAIPPVVIKHLQKLGYREGPKGTVRIACGVCYRGPTLVMEPDKWVIPTWVEKFYYPWGECIWFPFRSMASGREDQSKTRRK